MEKVINGEDLNPAYEAWMVTNFTKIIASLEDPNRVARTENYVKLLGLKTLKSRDIH